MARASVLPFLEFGFEASQEQPGYAVKSCHPITQSVSFMTSRSDKSMRELIGYVQIEDTILQTSQVVSTVIFDERGIHGRGPTISYSADDKEAPRDVIERYILPWSEYYFDLGNVAGLILAEYSESDTVDYLNTPRANPVFVDSLPPAGNRKMGIVEAELGNTMLGRRYFAEYREFVEKKALKAKGKYKEEYEAELSLLHDRLLRLSALH
ncbi:MAG: hypothetical protein ABJ308_15725 [Halieaceae bacterium]